MLDLALANDRLLDAANGGCSRDGRYFDGYFHAHFSARMDPRRNVNVHADIYIGELRVYERINGSSRASLKTSGGDRYAVTNTELGWLSVNGTKLGILDDVRCAVRGQRVQGSSGQGNTVVCGQVSKLA